MEQVLEGNLARFEVPDLLTFLNMGRRTGVLVMERPEQETKIFFRDGQPIFSTSTKEDLRAPSLLVRQGKVPEERAELLRMYHPTGVEKMGQVLISENLLSERELGPFLKVQISEAIFDTFTWRGGVFTFFDKVPPPETAVTIEIDLQNLIMEGVRRIDERGRLEELFEDRDQVIEVIANPERVKHSVTLTGEEWRVFFVVDGRRSVDEILRLVGDVDELSTLEVIHNLMVANLVTLVGRRSDLEHEELPPAVEEKRTQKVSTAQPQAARPASEPHVVLSPAQPPRQQPDDARQIVNERAVEYAGKNLVIVGHLVLTTRDGAERSFPLTKDSSTLGRHRNNDMVISDPKVSAFHARIDRTAKGFVLVDLESRNGSFVNGRKVQKMLLKNDDVVRAGAARLRYQVDFESAS